MKIDRFVAWLFRDEKAAEERGRRAGMLRAVHIIRNTVWEFPFEGRSIGTILNESFETVAQVIEAEIK